MAATTVHPIPAHAEYEFGDPTPNAVGRAALVSHSQCVVRLSQDSRPRLLWSGEDLLRVKLPAGSRVVYPKPTIPPLKDRDGAIRYALENPEEMAPFTDHLRPGMKVTVAIDDISLPLPKMNKPDIRQSVLQIVLETLAEHGVTDVEIIIATSFHRRMEPFEIRWQVGAKIFDAYYPDKLYCHDGEKPDGMVELGVTELGEKVRMNRRAAESDLLVYVNINLVPMDGGGKSIAIGLCDYQALQAHHDPKTIRECDSYFDHKRSALTASADRQAKIIREHVKVFHIETVVNNQMFDPRMAFFMKNEDRWNPYDRMMGAIAKKGLSMLPRKAKREVLFQIPAPYGLIAVHAGETWATHRKTLAYCYQQYCVPIEGQADVAIFGVPFVSPYNVNSPLNPLLVQVMALGYLFNMYRGMPIVKKNGVLILTHPLYNEFSNKHHPSYHEFFHRVLPETTDSFTLQRKYEAEFVQAPEYIRQYREGYAYHGVHPFYMWYWGENGRAHVGKVICVGAEDKHAAQIMGWETAATMEEALEMARTYVGREPSVTHMHIPPINMADVSGTPETLGAA
ncbi:MAG: DUF2088 domain-containing protein [Acidobacteria bacterium]|nr:DUF2088 domain-containing protein [Acidobacteriota bacterium]